MVNKIFQNVEKMNADIPALFAIEKSNKKNEQIKNRIPCSWIEYNAYVHSFYWHCTMWSMLYFNCSVIFYI